MAAKIKLQRKGAKNKPFYRVVVQDESAARDGRVIEILGSYDPLKDPSLFDVNKEKTQDWLNKGAEPTEKVRILLGKAGLMPAIDLASLPKKKSKAQLKAEAVAEGEAKPAAGEAKTEEKPAETKAEEPKKEEPKKEEPKKEEAKAKAEAKAEAKEEAKPEASK